ncbi:MAG TPA: ribbon-helix-helix protein, CopG family [Gemmatimonadales bacterium]|jgi:metal-responsive CopG/Arc/MetJ family transcriptional regulator|nr:ribbon-helix-helix protein, CopG family [Gemmatimonadales bacterium]
MKTAISLPDDLFASAEALAERLGVSRSRLFQAAVAEFVAKHQSRKVTERLDAVYAAEPSALDSEVRQAQRRRLPKDNW